MNDVHGRVIVVTATRFHKPAARRNVTADRNF